MVVGGFVVFQVFFVFDEGWWVGDYYVEVFVGGFQFVQGFEYVVFDVGDFFCYVVQCCVVFDVVEGEGGCVYVYYFVGVEGGGLDVLVIDIVEQVEDLFVLYVGCQVCVVYVVVVELVGFLFGQYWCFEFYVVFFQCNLFWYFVVGVGYVVFQVFGVVCVGVVFLEYGGGFDYLQQGSEYFVFVQFYGCGCQLYYQYVVEVIDYQVGQQVGIVVDQLVEWFVEKLFVQVEGDVDVMNQQ